jgi:DNA-damage-inducible protein J
MKTDHLSTRIDPDLKAEAQGILSALGLSQTDAITMFFRQIVLRRGLPFDVRVPNDVTTAALRAVEAGDVAEFRGSTKEAFDAILRKK